MAAHHVLLQQHCAVLRSAGGNATAGFQCSSREGQEQLLILVSRVCQGRQHREACPYPCHSPCEPNT